MCKKTLALTLAAMQPAWCEKGLFSHVDYDPVPLYVDPLVQLLLAPLLMGWLVVAVDAWRHRSPLLLVLVALALGTVEAFCVDLLLFVLLVCSGNPQGSYTVPVLLVPLLVFPLLFFQLARIARPAPPRTEEQLETERQELSKFFPPGLQIPPRE